MSDENHRILAVDVTTMLPVETDVLDALGVYFEVPKGSSVLNVASYPSAVAAVAAAGDGDTVHFPPGTYVNPAGVGNGITVLADNVILDFSPGVEIHVPTWGQAGIDAFNCSGVVVRGRPTVRYIGTRGTHASLGSYRGSNGYVNTAGFYTNRDRCDIDLRTIGMVCGVFLSSYDGVSQIDRMGVDNVIRHLECEDYNFGALWVGQDGLRIDDIAGRGDLDDSGGVNPTHVYYSSATAAFHAKNVTIAKALAVDNVGGQAFQLKYVDRVMLGPHIAQDCAGLLNVIDCTDLDAQSMTGTGMLPSLTVPNGAITCQGNDSERLRITATVVMDTVTGVNQRAIYVIADNSVFDFTLISNRTSSAAATTPEIMAVGVNNDVVVDIRNVSAYPAVAVAIGNGSIASTGTKITLRRIAACLRGVDWYDLSGGTLHLTRAHVALTSSALYTIQSGSPVFTVFEDGTLTGSGTPESVVTAAVGSLFKRTDGAAGTAFYIKESGTGNTGWRAVGGTPADIQEFTASGTWTKPAGAKTVDVTVIGAGCGGGSGRRGASGSVCGGGGGGAAGPMLHRVFDASDLASTESVVVSAGGAGGVAATADNTNGAVGDFPASATSFGTSVTKRVFAPQGFSASRGQGGTTAGGAGGVSHFTGASVGTGAAGGTGAVGTGVNPSIVGPAPGPGGGGISATPAAFGGGAGAYSVLAASSGSGVGGVVDSTAPTAGTAPGGKGAPGQSAGGGAASITTAAQAGAAATGYGAGGAGGGASLNGNNSGAGGAGGPGYVLVVTYF